jgi:hypothetical protein
MQSRRVGLGLLWVLCWLAFFRLPFFCTVTTNNRGIMRMFDYPGLLTGDLLIDPDAGECGYYYVFPPLAMINPFYEGILKMFVFGLIIDQ